MKNLQVNVTKSEKNWQISEKKSEKKSQKVTN